MLWKPGGATYNLFWECPGDSPRGTVTEPRLDRWLTVKEAQCWQDVSCKMSCKDKKADSSLIGREHGNTPNIKAVKHELGNGRPGER